MTRATLTLGACILASAALLALLVSILRDARAPVVACYKPWLSVQDERATCAIEAALAAHAQGKPRPRVELHTKWRSHNGNR